MRLKSLDNCIIQNNNMMQYTVHYFSELNKKEKKRTTSTFGNTDIQVM